MAAGEVSALPKKIFSQVCGHHYAEGLRKTRLNGQIYIECLNKKSLPKSYPTEIDFNCHYETHIEGRWRNFRNTEYKTCLSKKSLGKTYETYYLNECQRGYDTNGQVFHPRYDDPYIKCKIRE